LLTPIVRLTGLGLALSVIVGPETLEGEETRFEIVPRFVVVTAGGEPANDILGFGFAGRFRLSEQWLLGFAVDRADYDFEQPARTLGLKQDPSAEPIDAKATATALSGWIEREYSAGSGRFRFFWNGGVGVASPDVDDVSGPLSGGGSFDITTDPGTELILSLGGGVKARLWKHLALELAARADHHLMDWEVMDRVSGRSGKLDDYTGIGGHFGLNFRF